MFPRGCNIVPGKAGDTFEHIYACNNYPRVLGLTSTSFLFYFMTFTFNKGLEYDEFGELLMYRAGTPLAIAHKVVHDGQIIVRMTDEEGTSIVMYIGDTSRAWPMGNRRDVGGRFMICVDRFDAYVFSLNNEVHPGYLEAKWPHFCKFFGTRLTAGMAKLLTEIGQMINAIEKHEAFKIPQEEV